MILAQLLRAASESKGKRLQPARVAPARGTGVAVELSGKHVEFGEDRGRATLTAVAKPVDPFEGRANRARPLGLNRPDCGSS